MEYGQEVWAYGAPEDLADRVRPYDALDVEAPGDVGGERTRPHARSPPDEDDYGLGRLPENTPLIEPADDQGVLLDQLVADPGEDLLLLDRVALLGQEPAWARVCARMPRENGVSLSALTTLMSRSSIAPPGALLSPSRRGCGVLRTSAPASSSRGSKRTA